MRFHASDWIFTETGKCPLNSYSKAKRRLDKRMTATLRALARARGLEPEGVKLHPWVNHDLRRVLRTNLSALQVPDVVAEMALGHGPRGLRRVYDLHRYLPEIAVAMGKWADRVRAIVEPAGAVPEPTLGANVVRLKKSA